MVFGFYELKLLLSLIYVPLMLFFVLKRPEKETLILITLGTLLYSIIFFLENQKNQKTIDSFNAHKIIYCGGDSTSNIVLKSLGWKLKDGIITKKDTEFFIGECHD